MAADRSTRDLSDKHAAHIEALFGATTMRGSGNQFNRQTDNRMDHGLEFAFAFEGKATRNQSLTVSRADWDKLVRQAHDLRPAMAYRWYAPNNLLTPQLDTVMIRADDLAELLERANGS